MMMIGVPTSAAAILPRGQENGRTAYRQFVRGLRQTHAAKAPGPFGLRRGGRPRCRRSATQVGRPNIIMLQEHP
jgi:hypothetical protein